MALASYIIGSGLTALIGGISYNYLFIKKENLEENEDLNESINYSLIDEKLNDNCFKKSGQKQKNVHQDSRSHQEGVVGESESCSLFWFAPHALLPSTLTLFLCYESICD